MKEPSVALPAPEPSGIGDSRSPAPLRSFRKLLAVRVTVGMSAAVGAVALLSYLGLRQILDQELEASLLSVASIQAATVTDDPTGAMHFHEWELTADEAASVRDLIRYLQIWNADGESLVRSAFLTEDLPLDTGALSKAVSGRIAWTEGTFGGSPIRALYYPLERLGQLHSRHVLQVAAPLDARNRMLRTVGLLFLALLTTTAASTFIGAGWLAGYAIRPVDTIIDQAEAIAPSGPHRGIEAYADTWEYQRLVQVLNRMVTRLDSALEAQRRFTADASHELRTPLTVLRGELEVALRRDRSQEEYVRVLRSALEEAERLSRLSEDLLTLTRSDTGVLQPAMRWVDLAERVSQVVERLRHQAAGKAVVLRGPSCESVIAELDPDLMDRVVWNLVGNAVKFSPPGGEVEVALESSEGRLRLTVADRGPGIQPEDLEQVFERFYRGDKSRTHDGEAAGTGLGLAICLAIIEGHGGAITVRNREGGGALFQVVLPQEGRKGERRGHVSAPPDSPSEA